MRKLLVSEWMTLDGVFDADSMDKWFFPYNNDERMKYIREMILEADALLIGRTTYEMLSSYWSTKKNNEDGIADKINSMPKYVVSSSLKKADWNNSKIIKDHVVKEITKLKKKSGTNLLITGSATLVDSLLDSGLIDNYYFLIHPVIMGKGKHFFKKDMDLTKLKLLKTKTFDQGIILLTYAPEKKKN